MTIAEAIMQHVEPLPKSVQVEILDFVGYLESKKQNKKQPDWSSFSLSQAMRGMESEDSLYKTSDLKGRKCQSYYFSILKEQLNHSAVRSIAGNAEASPAQCYSVTGGRKTCCLYPNSNETAIAE